MTFKIILEIILIILHYNVIMHYIWITSIEKPHYDI